MITRHFITIPASDGQPPRKVHYRKCGSGPALLLVHQSPRSSREYESLMRKWSAHFTCIAPDSPGFGQSDAMPGEPGVEEFASAIHAFLDAVGIARCHAYGFHSGGIFLAYAMRQQPRRFHALAIGGYPAFTPDEMTGLAQGYLPPFLPGAYGEHLVWGWNRLLEQSWFFPWYDVRNETRLPAPHARLDHVQAMVMDLLDSGNAYRHGYRAALLTPFWKPEPGLETAPVLISTYRADPILAHMDRYRTLPDNWRTSQAELPEGHEADCLAFLCEFPGTDCPALAEAADEGFLTIGEGLVHWQGTPGAASLTLHEPAAELATPANGALAIDVPGHGLSDPVADISAVIEAASAMLGAGRIVWPALPAGEVAALYPDLSPDRFGSHLVKAWAIARAECFFIPWYATGPDSVTAFDPASIAPESIALRARARLRAGPAAAQWHKAIQTYRSEAKHG
jgi:haloalkane dehalogenase